jgi:peptidoglycan/xylan/chitin deacetylase (PgdA/CDA1 family)
MRQGITEEERVQYCGIAWSADGFTAECLDDRGWPVQPPVRFGGADVVAMAGSLVALAERAGGELAIVVDSTNGIIDGTLLAAGLDVFRADPPQLGRRPVLGSVDAHALADLARHRPDAVTPLRLDDGSLTGRLAEMSEGVKQARPAKEKMSEAGTLVRHGPRDGTMVALTFDDGPHPQFTGDVLGVLARYGIRATFFCVGLNAVSMERQVSHLADLGHCVANHTWSHPYLPDLSAAELREQVDRTREVITRAAGDLPPLMRPPYGSLTPSVLDNWTGYDETIVLWDTEAEDWARPGPEVIADRVLAKAQPGSIILLHDAGGDRSQTVASLPVIIEGCLERGWSFGTVPELIGC